MSNPHLNAPREPHTANPGLRLLFHSPQIPGNTGNTIRLAAITGAELHLVEPLGFNFDDAHLRRAGLDYHDLAAVTLHPDFDSALAALNLSSPSATTAESPDSPNLYAFTARGEQLYTEVAYQPGDVLLFGRESTGLDEDVLADERITSRLRLPMQTGRRSLNLANSASIALFEAWRQHDFAGSA